VARVEGRLAGFLLGFIKFGGPRLPADWHERFDGDLRLESQVMGVSPDFRGMGIGGLLKRVQGQDARAEGMGVVHWTFDPLQFPNAALNFGRLRALAFDFYPDLYPFRNALNRLPASRFGVTWLVGGRRVQAASASRAHVPDLAAAAPIARVNRGPDPVDVTPDSPRIAIEIPADWTALQQRDPAAAAAWREATDRLFARLVGREPGQYVITGVARAGERRFLVGVRAGEALWARLGA
jgi:predicted GNAT superfamily acetyltransferase